MGKYQKGKKKKKGIKKIKSLDEEEHEIVVDDEKKEKVDQFLREHGEVRKIGGARMKHYPRRNDAFDYTLYRTKMNKLLYFTEHLNVDNPIKTIETHFINGKKLIFDDPNNYKSINRRSKEDYRIRYIQSSNCFIIGRHGLQEREIVPSYIVGDAPVLNDSNNALVRLDASSIERKIKMEMIKKCDMVPYDNIVESITFRLETGEVWRLGKPELFCVSRVYYVIFGNVNAEMTAPTGNENANIRPRDTSRFKSRQQEKFEQKIERMISRSRSRMQQISRKMSMAVRRIGGRRNG